MVRHLLSEAVQILKKSGIPSARLDAEVLLSHCLDCDRLEFLKNPDMKISRGKRARFRRLVFRRAKGEPVAYLTGRKAFWTFSLHVNNRVLIPRPDTEILVEETLSVCRKIRAERVDILEIGTGSGAVALALASEVPRARIVATDISSSALNIARKNARALILNHRIEFKKSDLFQAVKGNFDVIVCNPPYIAEREYERLAAGIRDYEPSIALLSGRKGTEFAERLIVQAPAYLVKKGWLLIEIGAKQQKSVCGFLSKTGAYDEVAVRRDYGGSPRVVLARRATVG